MHLSLPLFQIPPRGSVKQCDKNKCSNRKTYCNLMCKYRIICKHFKDMTYKF